MGDWLDQIAEAVRVDPDWVARNSMKMRAPLKRSTMFTSAGRSVQHRPGERVIYGANGAALCRVTEDEAHNTQIEEGERLHATVRPDAIPFPMMFAPVRPKSSASAMPAPIRSKFKARMK